MKIRLLLILLITPFVFVGCGGGGGDSTTSTTASTGVVAGKIDGFGSILIANRKLTTDSSTEVEIEDEVSVWDDSMKDTVLKTGQIAFVQETNGHADRIKVDENVKGPVDGFDVDGNLMVMGQTVVQGAGTVDDSCPSNLLNAEVVEVYGLVDDTGAIQANIIECKTRSEVNRYSVVGTVSGFASGGNTFQINGLTVEITATTDTDDLFGGEPQNGQLVQVKDNDKAYAAGSSFMIATKVEPQVSLGDLASPDDDMEIESYVTDDSGLPDSFKMGDLTVNISLSTSFLFGDASLIANGVKLEAEGHINSNGDLDADKIKFEDNDSRVDALVFSVNASNGIIDLLDDKVKVIVDGNTEMEDGITIDNINDGDPLEVSGFIGANGDFVASEVKAGSGDADKPEIRSTASSINATDRTLVILGITINTDGGTEYKGHNDEILTADQFFAALVENVTTVQVKWENYIDDVSIPAKELELEDD